MHTVEYERFKRTFLQNYFSQKAQCRFVQRDWTRGAYFKTKGEEKNSNIWQWRRCLVIFRQQKEFSGAILSLETDSVFMVTRFFCELLGENAREYRKLDLISNNYTEVSDENGTLSFFFYNLKCSTYKNELIMQTDTLLNEIIRFNELSIF